jgi:hypothetical protein
MNHHYLLRGSIALFIVCCTSSAFAQLSLTGQIRTRTELRDGLGTLNPIGSRAAAFTSQRTGITFGYKTNRILFGATLRDVRVWGQDASSISNADGSKLFLHEAWAEVLLANKADSTFRFKAFDNLSLRVGRQEFNYDDVRLLGNLDWLQQGRRFDAALLKATKAGWQFDLGIAFNQNSDAFGVRGTGYVAANAPAYATNNRGLLVAVPTGFLPTTTKGGAPVLANVVSTNGQNQQFKALQFLYVSRKFGQTKLSALLLKDDFSPYRSDSVGNATNGWLYGRRYDQMGVNSRVTYGGMLTGAVKAGAKGQLLWQAFAYGQGGHDRDGVQVKAYHYGGSIQSKQGKLTTGPGYEVLSGDNTVSPNGVNNRFDPLYGTPHRHWGFMDYFYVGTGSPVGGLANGYWKSRYQANPNLYVVLDVHTFALANNVKNTLDASRLSKSLGQEIDLILNYNLNKWANLELGYSYLHATNSLEFVKLGTMNQARHNARWAYLMLNIRPDFLSTSLK